LIHFYKRYEKPKLISEYRQGRGMYWKRRRVVDKSTDAHVKS